MNFITSMLSDSANGTVSSKRTVTILAFLMCSGGFVASICGYTVDSKLFESMMYIVIAGLGFTASEKFTNKDQK
jgi:hypothetical protein